MMTYRLTSYLASLLSSGLLFMAVGESVWGDDTEVYQSVYTVDKPAGRPKVLIVFDDSQSMGTSLLSRVPYDPNDIYPITFDEDRIYWVDQNGNEGSFSASANFCAESFPALGTTGYFDTRALRWEGTAVSGESDLVENADWSALGQGDRDDAIVDCEVDVLNSNPVNGGEEEDGYPYVPPLVSVNDQQLRDQTLKYSAVLRDESNVNWGTQSYRFRTGHYMNWDADPRPGLGILSRMEVAQNVVADLVKSNRGIDFGLALFNNNETSANDGGRIVQHILSGVDDPPTAIDRETHRSELITIIDGLQSQGESPLCESTYEAYRYLSGSSVLYGRQWKEGTDSPPPDPLAEDPDSIGSYLSPAANCAFTYIILMTDGEPTLDTDANAAIESLTGQTCSAYDTTTVSESGEEIVVTGDKNCLPELAEYMATTDLDGDASNGNQYGITYTIGFFTQQDLLEETAMRGKGEYFPVERAIDLTTAFQGVILNILSTEASFSSPSVAVDSFLRTQSRSEVFLSMFEPRETVDWPGNIKKLQVDISDGIASLVDRNRRAAINPVSGEIIPNASTFWSDGDGGRVEEGGVGALLASRDPATRDIRTNTGTNGALEEFSSDNLNAEAYGFDQSAPDDPDGALFDLFGVSDQAELDALIDWATGYEVNPEDGSVVGTRSWILGDMLHSKPLVVNYGALGIFDPNEPDQRIVVGSNSGFLHMFGNSDGQEDWAFFPKELAPVLARRAGNAISPDHVYGVDGSPVLYQSDRNRDGTISYADGDKAYLYFGLRRGGRILYALDISDPDNPRFLWYIDQTSTGFSEIGQTWSDPVVTYIPGYVDGDNRRKPVLLFAAGYDPAKDAPGLATPDSMGRGIYIVDAATGALVWSVTPAQNSSTNLQATGLEHSVPSVLSPLDSNGDELTDRIYFGDTGGNLWRVDMPGDSLPGANQDSWSIVKMANMNGGTEATDRRFFNAVDIVRTTFSGRIFDALLIGTGDRSNPNATDVSNQFYMIRDERVLPYFAAQPTVLDCASQYTIPDFRCQLPLDPNDLFDVSDNLIQDGTQEEQSTVLTSLLTSNGWRLDLAAAGEKNLSRSVSIAGTAYFTTFSPEAESINLCQPYPGTARLYAIDLATAGAVFDFGGDTSAERSWIIGTLIPDTPAPHFGSDGEIRLLLPPGSGGGELTSNPFDTGASLPKPYGSYWYREQF